METLFLQMSESGAVDKPAVAPIGFGVSTVLEADFLVSMPKIKTHHWAGVTLSMKNMFGVVPGARYGWPKNVLHWKGIQESILDLCATVPIHFVIAERVSHIREGSRFLGNSSPALIDQVGEAVNAPRNPLQVVPEFRHLYAP
jgi:Domain of unknown function (DUF362)